MQKIRVRFAPSPTGYMHIGSLRTALYNYLFAKNNGGDFLLRIEDTDRKRFVKEAEENLLEILKHFGLNPDEDFIRQSDRLEIYKKYAEQLVKDGRAYYCFCTSQRLEEMRKEQMALKQAPIYNRRCLGLSQKEINEKLKNNIPYTIRLKMPRGKIIELDDLIRGKVKFNTDLIDDQVLLKSDGFPTYHLANVVDDYAMKITHAIRAEEWLPSTPKHLVLYEYLGWKPPKFAHIPLILNPDKSKLSKRQGDVAVEDYIKKGYLKEAIINFVALLGWNPGEGETREIFSMKELIKKFDLAHVHKAGAIFDLKKMDWINSQWIKKINLDDLYERALPFYRKFLKNISSPAPISSGRHLPPASSAGRQAGKEDYLKKVLTIERERLTKLSEVGESHKFFFQDIDYNKELLRWKDMPDEKLKNNLEKAKNILSNISEENWAKENLEKILMETAGSNKGEFLWPLRTALTGEQKSPSPFECAWILGKEESLKRIENALLKDMGRSDLHNGGLTSNNS